MEDTFYTSRGWVLTTPVWQLQFWSQWRPPPFIVCVDGPSKLSTSLVICCIVCSIALIFCACGMDCIPTIIRISAETYTNVSMTKLLSRSRMSFDISRSPTVLVNSIFLLYVWLVLLLLSACLTFSRSSLNTRAVYLIISLTPISNASGRRPSGKSLCKISESSLPALDRLGDTSCPWKSSPLLFRICWYNFDSSSEIS